MRAVALVALLLLVGCSGESSTIKYDPLKATSTANVSVGYVPLPDHPKAHTMFLASMYGDGKAPKSWKCSLSASVMGPKGTPDTLGERPKLKIGTADNWKEFETFVSGGLPGSDERNDMASFDVELSDLVDLAETGKLFLNGKPFSLNDDEKAKLRSAIIEAREATEKGK